MDSYFIRRREVLMVQSRPGCLLGAKDGGPMQKQGWAVSILTAPCTAWVLSKVCKHDGRGMLLCDSGEPGVVEAARG